MHPGEGEYRHQRSVVVYAHQQIADRLKQRTIGSSRNHELLAECHRDIRLTRPTM